MKATGKIIQIFESAQAASRYLKKGSSHIIETCNGKHHTAYGYKWEYI